MRRLSYAVCCAVLVAACAQESSTPASPGCLMSSIYGGSTCAMGGAMTEAVCTAQAGAWQAGGCPGEGQLGTCTTNAGTVVYYSGWWTAASAEWACTGTWMPVPAPPPPPAPSGTVTVSCTDAYLCLDATGTFSDASYAEFVASCSGTIAQAACALSNAVPGHCELTTTEPGYEGLAVRIYMSATVFSSSTAADACTSENTATTTATWVP